MSPQVVVIGAGPTGLMVAGDLAEAGIPVTVVERRRAQDPHVTRAFGVHAATLEQLDIRGIADELVGTGSAVQRLQLFGSVRVDLGRLPSRFNYLLITPQSQTEKVLRDRAEAAGATFASGYEVIRLTQDSQAVATFARRSDGSVEEFHSSYVIGADGVHSTVRSSIGVPFPGRSVLRSIMLADVRMSEPPDQGLALHAVADGFSVVVPFGDGWYRVIGWDRRNQAEAQQPVKLQEIRRVAVRVLGTDYGMHSPRWLSRFHSDERLATTYRAGRVFLAGDAAHVHSPAGGQGMNAAIQDAANLGWKLAAVLRGQADEALLDTYESERRPVGAQVIRTSGALLRMATMKSASARAARNTLGRLISAAPPLVDHAAEVVSGVGLRYRPPSGADRRVGTRVGDLPLADGYLHQALREGGCVVVADSAPMPVSGPFRWVRPQAPIGEPVLIRPDGYIGWVGDPQDYPYWR